MCKTTQLLTLSLITLLITTLLSQSVLAASGGKDRQPASQNETAQKQKHKNNKSAEPRKTNKGGLGRDSGLARTRGKVDEKQQVRHAGARGQGPAGQAGQPASGAESSQPEQAAEPAANLIITGKVIHGEAYGAVRVAVVDVQEVFKKIPAYQKIKKENLSRTKGRYHILLNQANEEFVSAVKSIAQVHHVDVVVEKGGVRGGAGVLDITKEVLKALPKSQG